MFEKVKNYDPSIPKAGLGFLGFKWSTLFIADYAFSLTKKVGKDGKQEFGYESNSFAGRLFRKYHAQIADYLKNKNTPKYDRPIILPSIDAEYVDKEFFLKWCKEANMPIVIKGYLKDAKVTEATTLKTLVEEQGHKTIKYVPKEDRIQSNRVGQNVRLLETTLKEYLTEDEHIDNYVNGFYGILGDEDYYEKCRGDEIDEFRNQKSAISQWFIGRRKNSRTPLHNALGDNMFLNVQGRKEWLFIHPSYLPIFKPMLADYGTYTSAGLKEDVFTDTDGYENLVTDHPFLADVPFYTYILEPGDVLYNPSFWWHNVRNHSDFNVGCAVRYEAKHVDSGSWTLSICCLIIATIKNPKKSILPQMVRILRGNVESKKGFIDTIFSSNNSSK